MTEVALIRHGPTEWNEIGRVQGRSDPSLSEAGRAEVARWTVPKRIATFDWTTSPLRRAVETAELLGRPEARPEPRLVEMHWGEWEGATLAELRTRYGDEMIENEARGLDFRAPAGESPREVQARVRSWLADVAARGRPTVAVSHKGVIRAMLALATGWDMTTEPPAPIEWAACHVFAVDGVGQPRIVRLNVGLGGR
ncbi:MAG: histidine phosphatase family protein [Alphaproteobacteria bacterium]